VLPDINLKGRWRRVVFLLHFHRLRGGCLLFFRRHCLEVARAHMHHGPVLGTELLSQPLGAGTPCRGRERLRAGGAPRRLVPVKPLVDMPLTNDRSVVDCSLIDCASSSQQLPFCLRQRLQRSSALLATESAWVLQTHEYSRQAMSARTHSTTHEQHTYTLSAKYTQHCRSTSHASEMGESSPRSVRHRWCC
jgi:hypothetical protein